MSIFHFDQNVQIFHKGVQIRPQSQTEDPTYLGFNFIFDFDPVHRGHDDKLTHDALFAGTYEGTTVKSPGDLDSAALYLSQLGYTEKAKMLLQFKESLRDINKNTPYYFQSVEGIPDLWKIEKGEAFNSFRGKDKVLTINCLESFDMRITALADLYRKATFDAQSMRELLPENLRHFTLKLQIMEIRKFHKIKEFAKTDEPGSMMNLPNPLDGANSALGGAITNSQNKDFNPKQTEFEMVSNNISVIEFQLSYCEFDFDESFPIESASHADPEMAKQKFKIKVGRVLETNTYVNLLEFVNNAILKDAYSASNGIVDNSSVITTKMPADSVIKEEKSKSNAYADNASKYGQLSTLMGGALSDLAKKIERAPSDLIARGLNNIQSKVTGAVLGNVYDLRNQSLGTIVNKFLGKNDQVPAQGAGGNVYPPPTKPATLGKEDAYPNVPETPKNYPQSLENTYPAPTKPQKLGTENALSPPPTPPTLGKEDVYPDVPEAPKNYPTDLGNVFK